MLGGGGLAGSMQMDRRLLFMKKDVLKGLNTLSSLKPLGQSKPTLCGASLGKGNES